MDPSRWSEIERLFQAVLDRPTPQRAPFLARACATDVELRAEVERLLALDATEDDLLARYRPVPERGAARPDPSVGRQVGAYRLIARIAAGGMGVVYRAVRADGLYEQEVAVKLLRAEAAGEDALRRFDFERRTLAGLNHPHIARLYDGGTTPEGTPYFVMEYVHGLAIDRWCQERGLTVERRLELFRAACLAVHFAHQNLIVHGDLKPPNILVDASGTVKLLDFGIARLLGSGDQAPAERTLTLARILTPEYASPEQWRGEPLTTAADVYSLGVLLYVLLTGRKPFRCAGMTAGEWEALLTGKDALRPSARVLPARAQEAGPSAEGEPSAEAFAASCRTSPARLGRTLRGDLDRIVLMALRKDRSRRYASALALAEDVERHQRGYPVQARVDTLAYRTGSFVRRNRIGVAVGALVLAAPSAGLYFSLRAEKRASREAAHARIEADSFRHIAELNLEALLAANGRDATQDVEAMRRTVLAQAEEVRRRYSSQPHLQANLLDALGLFCLRLGAETDAAALMEQALAMRELEFGAESLEVALSLRSLAELEDRQGDLARAAQLLERALALHRGLNGVHTDVALAASDLAAVLRKLGRLSDARTLYVEALGLRRARLGARSLPVAESLEDLSRVFLASGEPDEASSQLEEALAIREAALGGEHAETMRTRALLAATRGRGSG